MALLQSDSIYIDYPIVKNDEVQFTWPNRGPMFKRMDVPLQDAESIVVVQSTKEKLKLSQTYVPL